MSWSISNMLPMMGSGVGPGGKGSLRRFLAVILTISRSVKGNIKHSSIKCMEVTSSTHSILVLEVVSLFEGVSAD